MSHTARLSQPCAVGMRVVDGGAAGLESSSSQRAESSRPCDRAASPSLRSWGTETWDGFAEPVLCGKGADLWGVSRPGVSVCTLKNTWDEKY